MEKNFKRTTVTSALPYANGPVHIGHLAGVYVPADIYVRYLRLKKEEQESSGKTSISALLTMPKPLTVWITINCGNF